MADKIENADIYSHKIMTLEAEKRDRVINAAMKEFCHGFKKASTDAIVREAGISKGLLFHYFGSKEQLYRFIIAYACDTMTSEYFGLINVEQRDLLECLWQMTLLKRDLSYKHPSIFNFLIKAYLLAKEDTGGEFITQFKAIQEKVVADVFRNFDNSLFKEGIDPVKAANIVWWTLAGYAEKEVNIEKNTEDYQKEYERYLTDLRSYFDLFRQCFYK